MFFNIKIKHICLFITFTTTGCLSCYVSAAENDKAPKKSVYVIETLVKGSQEQPNVIYITPWQEDNDAVVIQEQSLQITLPKLTPVKERTFKQKLTDYYR